MEQLSVKTGDYVGAIGINEMVAFKLRESLYLRYMNEAHHEEPRRQEEAITARIDEIRDSAQRDGGDVEEFEGNAALRRSVPSRGKFAV
jgi:hypothetical protein